MTVKLHGETKHVQTCIVAYGYVKGKAISLQVLAGPEGSRRLRLPDLKTIGT
jgi:hypothetical protein